MVTKFPLRVKDRHAALAALINEFRSTKDAIEMFFEHVREVSAHSTKAVSVLGFACH